MKNRYMFFPHESRAGWYSVLDSRYGVRCDFEEHRFNESQEFYGIEDLPADPELISRIMREMGDWISLHHYSDAMPIPTYEYRMAEDGGSISIIRHKSPCFTLTTYTDVDTTSRQFADAVKKAAEFARKGRQL